MSWDLPNAVSSKGGEIIVKHFQESIPVRLGKMIGNLTRFPFIYKAWQTIFSRQKVGPLLVDLQFQRANRILDVGCGPGTNAGLFLDRDYIGVDCDQTYVETAKQKYGNRFILADAVKYSFVQNGVFDLILINSLLHHLDENEAHGVLANVREVMGPGSTVHILDLVLPLEIGLPRFLSKIDRGGHPRSLSHWRTLFLKYFNEIEFKPYCLSMAGLPFYQMVYFKGMIPKAIE